MKCNVRELTIDEQERHAFDKILRIVNKREISSSKMRCKLEMAGYDQEAIESSLTKAIEYGYIDDRRYSECLIRTALSMGKGLSQIEYEINGLGVDIFELEPYQQYLMEGEQAQLDRALAILRRHSTSSKNLYASCFRKLISKGYSASIAKSATMTYLNEIESTIEA